MATDAQIQGAITAATSLNLTPQNMFALLDRAIAAALVDIGSGLNIAGPYVVRTGSDNQALQFETLDAMIAAREYYRVQIIVTNGSMVVGLPEAGWIY